MSFLAPAAFVLALLLPILIAMYLLKLRRTRQVVSSVYLWQRFVHDVQANAPWQRLRRNLLLILQLLFLVLLILALARPFTWVQGASGQSAILILDASASMAATDVSPNRLEAARSQAHRLVDDLPDDARITVIAAGEGAQVRVSSSQDRRQVHRAIDGIQVGAGGSDLTAALELASAVAARQPETEVVILSDGRVTLPDRLALKGRVRYLPIGLYGDNQAIGMLSLQPVPGTDSLSAFVQVTNYAQSPVRRRLALYVNGQLEDAYDLDIAARDQQSVVVEGLLLETQVVEARLVEEDVLALDDRAWAVHRATDPAAVTLVTEGNLFLDTALALLPGLEVTTVRPADFEAGELSESADVERQAGSPAAWTILDAHVPLTATLPAGNLLFIAPPRSTAYFSVTGTIEQPVPRAASLPGQAGDPLMANVDLGEVSVLEAVRLVLPLWARSLVVADTAEESAPLLSVGEVDGRRVAVLAFDLRRSDLPLQVAFPLLLSNLSAWLAPGQGAAVPAQVVPGAPLSLSLPPEVEAVTVLRPDGRAAQLRPQGGQAVFADTQQVGLYEVRWSHRVAGGGQEEVQVRLVVNLFSPQESDLLPAETLPVVSGTGDGADLASQQARREWWRPLAWGALVLLVVEWLFYHRASVIRLWAGARHLLARLRASGQA